MIVTCDQPLMSLREASESHPRCSSVSSEGVDLAGGSAGPGGGFTL
jgi:hypothetical protein